jgi:hypothetical protein
MLQFLTHGLILWTEDCITICLWIGTGLWDSYYTGLRLRLKNRLFRSDTLLRQGLSLEDDTVW